LAERLSGRIKRPPVYRIFLVQTFVSISICAVFLVSSGRVAAYSALLGGLLFTVPQLYFGIKAFLYTGARSIHKITQSFYKGESAKILLIAVGFAVVFTTVKPLDYFALYFTFIVVLALNCLTPLLPGQWIRNR